MRVHRNPAISELLRTVEQVGDADLYGRGGFSLADALGEQGFETLGFGGSRIVVGLDADKVAKIDHSLSGSANYAEADLYRWNRDITDRLAPVFGLFLGGRVLVMARASQTFDSVPKKYVKELRAAMREVQGLPYASDREDPKYEQNYGLVKGVVVCIDYAS
jgi:hypothetical protein